MQHWVPNNKTLMSVSAGFLAVLAVYFVGLYLISSKIKSIEMVFANSKSESAQTERAEAILAVAESHKNNIMALKEFFIIAGDEVSFIEKIEDLARMAGVSFEIVSISQIKSSSPTKEDLVLRINIEGSWSSVTTFIKNLEALPFGTSILTANLDVKEEKGWSGFVELVVFREK